MKNSVKNPPRKKTPKKGTNSSSSSTASSRQRPILGGELQQGQTRPKKDPTNLSDRTTSCKTSRVGKSRPKERVVDKSPRKKKETDRTACTSSRRVEKPLQKENARSHAKTLAGFESREKKNAHYKGDSSTENSSDKSDSSSLTGSPAASCQPNKPYDKEEVIGDKKKTKKKRDKCSCCNKLTYTQMVLLAAILIVAAVAAYAPIMAIPYLASTSSHAAFADPPTPIPSMDPTGSPTTSFPSPAPSTRPTDTPSGFPSTVPSTTRPTNAPSQEPSSLPSKASSNHPTVVPTTTEPTQYPSQPPTITSSPTTIIDQTNNATNTTNTTTNTTTTIFYAIGDVPYNNREKLELAERMQNLPTDGDFLIHLGDIRSARDSRARCSLRDYVAVKNILLQSKIPVFIVPGDNEWNDCPNPIQGMSYWVETFSKFHTHWNHSFQVEHHFQWPENFHFLHKGTMYFGMNLVGGAVLSDKTLYSNQLRMQYDWMESKMNQHLEEVSRIVIFGHAFPIGKHDAFFDPLRQYVQRTLLDKVPILYLNGDNHFYDFEPNYRGLSSFQRLQVDFGTVNPPLKVVVSPLIDGSLNTNDTFSHDRMLGY